MKLEIIWELEELLEQKTLEKAQLEIDISDSVKYFNSDSIIELKRDLLRMCVEKIEELTMMIEWINNVSD